MGFVSARWVFASGWKRWWVEVEPRAACPGM